MSEYQSILSLYEKHKRYEGKIILFSLVMLGAASFFVALNLVHINPFLVYLLVMGVAMYFAFKIQVVSKNYSRLEKMVKQHDVEMYQNKELLFFIDYQLIYSPEWSERLEDYQESPEFDKMLVEMKNYYEYIKTETDDEFSLIESTES
ncbi:hypothetical protein ACQKKE_08465 [Desemzia incerta]|uniref:hypothetical protein n=1 Tax=Desemzia incerta TaxID=82801 RepID=UPI003D062CCE